jgi:tetratricopeptide (TPR) repeat protein
LAADARVGREETGRIRHAVAQRGLWREAIYRWERAAQIDPKYAEALNDLAIAYEHEGDSRKARVAYEKASSSNRTTRCIKQNYELFKEINDRTTRKDTQDSQTTRILSSVAGNPAHRGLHELLRDSYRNAHQAEARCVGVSARGWSPASSRAAPSDVDGILETTALLPQPAATKSELRVHRHHVLPLMEVARRKRRARRKWKAGAGFRPRSASTDEAAEVVEEGTTDVVRPEHRRDEPKVEAPQAATPD